MVNIEHIKVKRTCQGQLQYTKEHNNLFTAFIDIIKLILKYSKYHTMRFDLEIW